MRNPKRLRFAGLAFLAVTLGLLWSCNVSDPGKTTFLNLKLNDSLAADNGLYDSVRVDIYDGNKNLVYPGIFADPYVKVRDSATLANLDLGSNAPNPMIIEILGYKGGSEAVKITISVVNNQASNPIATVIEKPTPGPGNKTPKSIVISTANPLALSLGDGEAPLHASVLPDSANQGIQWTSSDSSVAAIKGGSSVKPGVPGSATLTAYSVLDPLVFARILVLVSSKVVHPESIVIQTASPLALSVTGLPVMLMAKVLPLTADPRIEWISINPAIASIENGNYARPVAVGKATLVARSVEDTLIKAILAVTVQADAILPNKVVIANANPLTLSLASAAIPLLGSIEPLGAAQGLVWTSADTSVAVISVDNQIKGVKVGSATVTATSAAAPTLRATLTVNVQADIIKPTGVSIETSSPLVLILGSSSVQLQASVIPGGANPEIIWTSANNDIAVVENGKFAKGVAPGETQLIAASKADTSLKKTLAVKVQNQVIAPKAITLLVPDSMSLAIGGSEGVLAAQVEPTGAKQDITWSVADTAIVKLTATGTVKPIKAGKTIITAKAKEDPAIAKTLVVEVIQPVKVDGITMTPKTLILYTGGDSARVTVAMQGNDGGAKYTLTSSDPLVASVKTDGTVRGIKAGTATVSASPVGYPALIAACEVEVKTDVPVILLSPGKDTTIAYNGEVTFAISVTQDYGTVLHIQADLDGNGAFDTTATGKATATFKRKYSAVGVVNTKFEAKDSEGNVATITRKITVSAPGTPEVTITDPAGAITIKATTYVLKFSVKDPANGTTVAKDSTLTGLKEGANTVTVVRGNAGGEGKDQVVITVDTKAPTPEITTTTTTTGSAGFTLAGKVSDAGSGVAKVTVTSAQATVAAGDATLAADGTWSKVGITLATGANTLDAIATDKAGNVSAKVSLKVTLDNAGPALTITPAATPTGTAGLTLTGTVSDAGSGVEKVTVTSAQAGVAAGDAAITGTNWTKSGITLKEGVNTFTVTATDKGGKTTTASITVNLDTTPPGKPNSGSVASPTNSKTPTFTWKSGGGNGTYQVRMDVDNFSTGFTEVKVASYAPAAQSDGSHTLYVRETDGNGNWSGSLGIGVVIDATKPTITVTGGAGTIGNTSTTLVFTANDGSGTGIPGTPTCKLGTKAFTVTKSGTSWNCAVTGLASGANTVNIDAVDGANNTGSGTASINVSVPDPTVEILSPKNNFITSNASVTISYEINNVAQPGLGWSLSEGKNERTISTPPNAVGKVASTTLTVYRKENVVFVTPKGSGLKDGTSWANARTIPSINSSYEGKEFWLGSGNYLEGFTVNASITVHGGFNAANEPFNLDNRSATNTTIFDIIANEGVSTFDNLVLVGGLQIENSRVNITDVTFNSDPANTSYGIIIDIYAGSTLISKNTKLSNVSQARATISVVSGSNATFTGGAITNNLGGDYAFTIGGGSASFTDVDLGGNTDAERPYSFLVTSGTLTITTPRNFECNTILNQGGTVTCKGGNVPPQE